MRIVVVEDDPSLGEILRIALKGGGYGVSLAADGETGLAAVLSARTDLVLLDVMLPRMDGYEVCRRIRANAAIRDVPIIMLTAKGEERDVVKGLDLGANDYITKPFSRPILLARIRAVLRSARGRAAGPFACDGLVLSPESHVVTLDGGRLSLTPGEYRMLELFLSRPNRIHTRAAILDAIQTETKDVTDRLVDVMLVALRRKLGAWAAHIETVRGIGYRLVCD
jgi:two-component system phosphate regulon response regulator PhoB